MNKKDIIIGIIIGFVTTIIGIGIYAIYIGFSLNLTQEELISHTLSTRFLGKRASIGVLLNLPVFYYFLNKKKENTAKGVLIAIIAVAIVFIANKF